MEVGDKKINEINNIEQIKDISKKQNILDTFSDLEKLNGENLELDDFKFLLDDCEEFEPEQFKEITEYFQNNLNNSNFINYIKKFGDLPTTYNDFLELKQKDFSSNTDNVENIINNLNSGVDKLFLEKQEDNQEKQEDNQEKQEDNQEKLSQDLKIKKDILNLGKNYFIKYGDIFEGKGFELSDFEDIKNVDKVKLFIESNYTLFLEEASKKGVEEFNKVSTEIKNLIENKTLNIEIDSFNKVFEKLNLEVKERDLKESIDIPLNGFNVVNNFTNNTGTYSRNGSTVDIGDERIKFDEIPPKKYITTETGYEVESTEIPKKEYKENKEIEKKQNYIERDGVRIDRNINVIENKKEDIKTQYDYINNITTFSEADLDKFYSKYINNFEIKSKIEAVTDDINNIEAHKELKGLLLRTIETSAIQIESELQKLRETKKEIEKNLKDLKEEKARNLKAMQEKVREEDKKAREIRDFISKTGFDLLPQPLTNQLINELKMNSLDIPGFNIDYTNIDISEGKFGESPTETEATKWKENLMLFMNKAIYGEFYPENSIIDPKQFIGPMGKRVNPTEFNELLKTQGIKNDLTGFDINKIRDNLRKNIK